MESFADVDGVLSLTSLSRRTLVGAIGFKGFSPLPMVKTLLSVSAEILLTGLNPLAEVSPQTDRRRVFLQLASDEKNCVLEHTKIDLV